MTIPGAPPPSPPPPEIENARKILELEKRQGYQDRAVTTGLASFLPGWQQRVARTGQPALRQVADGVLAALADYAKLAPAARAEQIEAALNLLADTPDPLTPRPPLPTVGEGEPDRLLPLSHGRERGPGGEGYP